MGQVFHPYEPEQPLLLRPAPSDWLPAGHLAHFVSDSVDQLDLTAWYVRYEQRADGRGQLAYEAAADGEAADLRLRDRHLFVAEDRAGARLPVPLRYLAAGNRPRHRTLARFREAHCTEFQALFVQVVRIARAAGLVAMGHRD